MPGKDRLVLQSIAVLISVTALGLGLWWYTSGTDESVAGDLTRADAAAASSLNSAGDTAASTSVPVVDATATAIPTATPVPTPTPVPEPRPFAELIARTDLVDTIQSPLPGCSLHGGDLSVAGTVSIRCIENSPSVDVVPIAGGRIVHINTEPAVNIAPLLYTGVPVGEWSWTAQAAIGRHVVVDHGTFAGSRNMQTVYAGLDTIAGGLRVGDQVEPTTVLGSIAATPLSLEFSLWDTNQRQDGAKTVLNGPDFATQQAAANALGSWIASPTDPLCPLSLGSTQLPGAARGYRNGTHQGIDFGCGTSGRYGTAIADGTVVYVVDDYVDPTVADREALLYNAGIAGFTPHWTLVMLYGNVVVIDHGIVEDAGRVYTIAAHLEAVDPAIKLGTTVTAGQRIGELGNRGTNAAAMGLRGAQDPSLHLHWELFIDNWFLGSGLSPVEVESIVRTTLCGNARTAGC